MVLLEINPAEKHGSAMAIWGVGIMVGPILGPAIGGWLTENWTWRWVFFINVPVGALAFYGIWRYIAAHPAVRRIRFDMFGFATLSIAIASLQMLLDRGQQNDWFAARESWVEGILFAISFAYFAAHTALSPEGKSFFNYRLLKNSNFVSGIILIFMVGLITFSGRALLATMLQNLMDYPATLTGFVTAPSGVGTMIGMLVVGRLVGRVDLRLLLAIGFGLTALSLWQMSGYDLTITQSDVVWPGLAQGLGTGLIFVPLAAAAFATLAPELRADGTAIFSLLRNIGSAIGISGAQALLVRNTQIAHAGLVENLGVANPSILKSPLATAFHLGSPTGFTVLNDEVTRQASMIAYVDDFLLMLIATLVVIPLLIFIRPSKHNGALAAESLMME
jgi:DHA2 family multidrug resistance protein